MSDTIHIDSGCHCGNITLGIEWPVSAREIHKRLCGCTFCRKHGGAWTSHRDAQLAVSIGDPSRLSKYRFGTATADFYVCARCGVAPIVVCDIDDISYAVVNVNAFENNDALSFTESATDFDGEDTGSRLERRKRNWIPNVRIDEAA